jgi:ATP-dependent DNA helicase RecQ
MEVLAALEKEESLTLRQLQAQVNASYGMIEKALKLLEVDGAVGQTFDKGVHFFRTPNPWQTDTARYEQVAALRRAELSQMQAYTRHTGCLMEFLQRALDDPHPTPCGRCANCRGRGLPSEVSPGLVLEAETYLKGSQVLITPRKQWPTGLFPDQKITIPKECQNQPGRSLCFYGDSGWGRLVKQGKYDDNHFAAELVQASAHLVRVLWQPDPFPAWVTCIPSQTRPSLVPDFAARLAEALELPFYPALQRTQPVPEQKTMHNAFMQARNVLGSLAVRGTIPPGPALLVDDIIHSGWTLTMGGYLLQQGGCNIVYPFTLARAAGRSDDAA